MLSVCFIKMKVACNWALKGFTRVQLEFRVLYCEVIVVVVHCKKLEVDLTLKWPSQL